MQVHAEEIKDLFIFQLERMKAVYANWGDEKRKWCRLMPKK